MSLSRSSSISRTSAMCCHRSCGFFSRHFAINLASGAGTPGASWPTGTGSLSSTAASVAISVSPWNGRAPVNIS